MPCSDLWTQVSYMEETVVKGEKCIKKEKQFRSRISVQDSFSFYSVLSAGELRFSQFQSEKYFFKPWNPLDICFIAHWGWLPSCLLHKGSSSLTPCRPWAWWKLQGPLCVPYPHLWEPQGAGPFRMFPRPPVCALWTVPTPRPSGCISYEESRRTSFDIASG